MILSDGDIYRELDKGSLKVIPCNRQDWIQPCSIDLHLGGELVTIEGKRINLSQASYKLKPNEFLLGSTNEYVEIPNYLCGQVDGRSSIARLGVSVHQTGGFIDSGFNGNITLEIYNCSHKEFELCWGDSLCQLVLHVLTSPCERPYGTAGLGSRYQGSEGVVRSRYGFGRQD